MTGRVALVGIALGLVAASCSDSHERQREVGLRSLEDEGEAGANGADDPGASGAGAGGGASAGTNSPGSGAAGGGEAGGSGAQAGSGMDDSAVVEAWLGRSRLSLESCESGDFVLTEGHRLLLLVEREQDRVTASLTIGEGPPLPPATKADEAYPPGGEPECLAQLFWPGFEYTGYDVRSEPSRLRVRFFSGEIFASWCALQRSYPASETARMYLGSEYLCRPTEGLSQDELLGVMLDADDSLCMSDWLRACRCDARGCEFELLYYFDLDLVGGGDTLEGALNFGSHSTEVRLQRVQ